MLSAANGYSSMYESSLVKLEAPFEAAANLWGENMRLIIWIYGYLPRLRSSLDTTYCGSSIRTPPQKLALQFVILLLLSPPLCHLYYKWKYYAADGGKGNHRCAT